MALDASSLSLDASSCLWTLPLFPSERLPRGPNFDEALPATCADVPRNCYTFCTQPHRIPAQSQTVVFSQVPQTAPRLTWLCTKIALSFKHNVPCRTLPVLMVLDLTRLWTSHVMPFMMTLRKETVGACSWATHAQLSKTTTFNPNHERTFAHFGMIKPP